MDDIYHQIRSESGHSITVENIDGEVSVNISGPSAPYSSRIEAFMSAQKTHELIYALMIEAAITPEMIGVYYRERVNND